jgi:hypothetical protein
MGHTGFSLYGIQVHPPLSPGGLVVVRLEVIPPRATRRRGSADVFPAQLRQKLFLDGDRKVGKARRVVVGYGVLMRVVVVVHRHRGVVDHGGKRGRGAALGYVRGFAMEGERRRVQRVGRVGT